jgi:hypothetical protein
MEEKKSFIEAILGEKRVIQDALRAVGYFVYSVNFVGTPSPNVKLEMRLWSEGDERLLEGQPGSAPTTAPQDEQ